MARLKYSVKFKYSENIKSCLIHKKKSKLCHCFSSLHKYVLMVLFLSDLVVSVVLIPLCQLKATSFDDYQRTWKRLDKELEGTMKGDFRDVAQEFGLVQEDVWELEKELKTPGSRSPSRQLLECLATRWPELTIFDFIKVLQKPNIDRGDIVNILKDYIYR